MAAASPGVDLGQVGRPLLLGQLGAQRQERAVAAMVLQRRLHLGQPLGDAGQPVRRNGRDQRPLRCAPRPLGALAAEAQHRLPVVARARADQHAVEADLVVAVGLEELAHRLLVQRGQLGGRGARRLGGRRVLAIGLGEQLFDEQHRAPQELRLVDRVAGRAGRAHQELHSAEAVALALRRLHAGLEEGGVLGGELEGGVDELLRLAVAAHLVEQHRLSAQRLGPRRRVLEERFLALVERERLLIAAGGGEETARRLEVGPVLRIQEEGVLVTDGGALLIAQLLDVDAPHRVVHRRGGLRAPESARLRLELGQHFLGGLDLGVGRVALGDGGWEFLGDDGVHALPNLSDGKG